MTLPDSSGIDTVVAAIAQENVLAGPAVGLAGVEPEQWRRYLRLKSEADAITLERLLDHPNAVVRGYAFQALAERDDGDVAAILLLHMADTASVATYFGCIRDQAQVADYLIGVVSRDNANHREGYVLTGDARRLVDSVLLYQPYIRLYERERALQEMTPRDDYYQRVRELAIEEREAAAIWALARYRRIEDVQVIRNALRSDDRDRLYYGLRAVSAYPDTVFYPELVRLFERFRRENKEVYEEFKALCLALVKYPNATTAALFKDALAEDDKHRRAEVSNAVVLAVTLHPHAVFEDVARSIVLDDAGERSLRTSIEFERDFGPEQRGTD